VIAPPSPVVIDFLGWKLKHPAIPIAPHRRSPYPAPIAVAASSMMGIPASLATDSMPGMSAA
jgi:hypothetical protein